MDAARLRCAAAIATATAVPAARALPIRRHPAFFRVPAAVGLRFSSCRIPVPRRAAAAMSSSAAAQGTEHEADAWYAVPGLSLRDHRFAVPLDHSSPERGDTITVFAREVVAGRSRLPASAHPIAIRAVLMWVCYVGYVMFRWKKLERCVGVLFGKYRHNPLGLDMIT